MAAAKNTAGNDVSLPFPALQLLAPPVRLVSAAVWKVLKQRDAARYGVVEEFVTSVCESVPGMLTFRHQGKLTLGLRGRLILELLLSPDQPDRELISRHLERFRAPEPCSTAHKLKKDVKIEKTVSSFHEMVETLLQDPAERLQFFKEEFPEEYGPKFDEELEKLLWEFLLRLDQLLPVPNLAQTVSWLSTAPPVLEECAQAATQPQLLKTILQYQACLGHLELAASLPPKMGDSILTSLSLLPSGKPPSDQQPAAAAAAADRVASPRSAAGAGRRPGAAAATATAEDKGGFVAPVIGLISNKDVPAMITAASRAKDKEERERSNGAKRKQPDDEEEEEEEGAGTEEEEEEEEEEERLVRRGASKRGRRSLKKQSRGRNGRRRSRSKSLSEDGDDGAPDPAGPRGQTPGAHGALLSTCLLRQPTVLLRRLDPAAAVVTANANAEGAGSKRDHDDESDDGGGGGGEQGGSGNARAKKKKKKNNVLKNSKGKQRKWREAESPCSDKENCHVYPGISSSPTITEALPTPGDSDDIIGDSEDEATKNFKGMLFVKRYYKTKHDTYVPTLREFCKPWMVRPNLLSPG